MPPLCGPISAITTLCEIARSGRVSVVRMRHKKTTNLTCFTANIAIVDTWSVLNIDYNYIKIPIAAG